MVCRASRVLALFLLVGCGRVGYATSASTPDADVPDADVPDVDVPPAPMCPDGSCKGVFVSSPVPASSPGGLVAADARCQADAETAGLGGTYRAWLASGATSPATTFTQAGVPYRLPSGATIAVSFADLVDGTLAHAIDEGATGAPILDAVEVWTGTSSAGVASTHDCAGWTNTGGGMPYGTVGLTNQTGAGWTQIYEQFCDRTGLRLYCFEQ